MTKHHAVRHSLLRGTTTIMTIFMVCLAVLLNAQEKEDIILHYGFNTMSSKGQDTMFFYFVNKFSLFELESAIGKQKPIPEIKDIFQEFFRNKLDEGDLHILNEHWDQKYADFRASTIKRGETYYKSTTCLKELVDTLEQTFLPELMSYKDAVYAALDSAQKALVKEVYSKSIKKLHKKRDEFLNLEKKFTKNITSSIYDYMEAGFSLMEKYPSCRYYSLIGANLSAINFIDTLNLQAYFDAYERFENRLDEQFDNNCRAHLGIPRYDNTKSCIKKNAILFMIQHLEGVRK